MGLLAEAKKSGGRHLYKSPHAQAFGVGLNLPGKMRKIRPRDQDSCGP